MIRRLLVATAVAALPAVAAAHAGDAAHDHGLTAGFMHPFTGLDHLAAMLAAPFAFAGLLLVGAVVGLGLGAQGLAVPGVEPMVAASVLVLGLVAAARWRLGATASAALVGAFAVFHGLAHGAELGGGAALVGMVLATALLHAGGLALGLKLRALAPVWSRAAGGAIALLGLGLLTRLVIA